MIVAPSRRVAGRRSVRQDRLHVGRGRLQLAGLAGQETCDRRIGEQGDCLLGAGRLGGGQAGRVAQDRVACHHRSVAGRDPPGEPFRCKSGRALSRAGRPASVQQGSRAVAGAGVPGCLRSDAQAGRASRGRSAARRAARSKAAAALA